jgi:hypothetical protein
MIHNGPGWPASNTALGGNRSTIAIEGRTEFPICRATVLPAGDAQYRIKHTLRWHPYRSIADRERFASALM